MNQKKSFLIWAVLFAVVLISAAVLYKVYGDTPMPGTVSQTETDTQQQPIPAPDFTVVDGEGNEVRLSDFVGKPIVLNFWASWCGPCKNEMPVFDAKAAELEGEVVFMMINATDGRRETLDSAKSFIDQSGYSFPVYYDVYHEANYWYGITTLPTTFFIHADGTVAGYVRGGVREEFLQQCIDVIHP